MSNRIKIRVLTSLRLSRRFFVLGISTIIVIGFLLPVLLSGEKRSLPALKIEDKHGGLISKIIAVTNSSIKAEEINEMTVDEYILKQQHSKTSENKNDGAVELKAGETTARISEFEREAILLAGRESVSKLVKHTIVGDERIVSIFTEAINRQINNYLNTNTEKIEVSAPWLFAGATFLIISSIAFLITMLLVLVASIFFRLLVWAKILKIESKQASMEVIQ